MEESCGVQRGTSESAPKMIRVIRICRKCGAKIFSDAPEGLCGRCVLKAALGNVADASVAGGVDPGRSDTPSGADENRAPNKTKSASAAELLGELGDYELLEEVGRGGQGVVFRARQKSLNRIVALKVISLGQWASKAHLKRFRVEAEAAARLEHPGIVPIHEVGERDGSCYFSMKFVEGGQLDEVVRRTPMSIRQAVELIAKVARTVHYAHEHGILHRDIKPGNILLDAKGEPHLTDFGLARLIESESSVTHTLDVLGTPSYMAPEQAVGNNAAVSSVTDVYGLGAVLYQLLTGQPPFAGGATYETIKLLLDTEPRQPRSLNAKIDRDLSTICLKCLEKDPKRRYSSALALAEDLERWLMHEPILARRTGIFARGKKWVRRNPTSAFLAACLVALAAAAGWIVWKSEFIRHPVTNGVAVLPFENLSPDPANAYFAEGIQDEILTRLASIADLKVISRTSTQRYRSKPRNLGDIAKQLGVAHIVEGSVQKTTDQVRVNVQLINAQTDFHLWADSYDRKVTDIFSVESEVAKAIADQLRAKLTGQEKQAIAAKPTENPEAYDAYLRGLAYDLKPELTTPDFLAQQKCFRDAVRLDPKFALAWAKLSDVDSAGYLQGGLQPTVALREEARQAAETALSLQPNLGEAILVKGLYYYSCRKDYDIAVRYFEQAHQFLPNRREIPELLGYVARRRGQWDRNESYFNEAERLDPLDLHLLTEHANSYFCLRRFPEARRKLDQVLAIAPGDVNSLLAKAYIAQTVGDLPRASEFLAPLHARDNNNPDVLWTQIRQAMLERRPAGIRQIIPRLQEILANADRESGYYNGGLRVLLGWAQEFADDHSAAQESCRQARSELEPFLKEQPEDVGLLRTLAMANLCIGDKSAARALAERAMAALPLEKDAYEGDAPIWTVARVAARSGEPDRAIAALRKLLSIPSGFTAYGFWLDPMFDPLRSDPRFQKFGEERQP
jgi:TolB-like protein/Tfp pilus assembly protein PilF/predicted Ser/Thr protein kinase